MADQATDQDIPKNENAKATARNAFGALLQLNVQNIATTLNSIKSKAKSNTTYGSAWNTINSIWIKYGGQPAVLDAFISAGKSKRPIMVKEFTSSADGESTDNAESPSTISKVSSFLKDGFNLFMAIKDSMKGLPEEKQVPKPPEPDFKILGMKPMVFGVVTILSLLTLGVATFVIIKAKRK